MGIDGLSNLNKYQKDIVVSILSNKDNKLIPSVAFLVDIALSLNDSDYVFIKRGLHSSYDIEKIAKENNFFTPVWFDVVVVKDGEQMNGGKTMHVYISKYAVNYLNQWQRINLEVDPQLGYSAVTSDYDKKFHVHHSFTGVITDKPTLNVFHGGKYKK